MKRWLIALAFIAPVVLLSPSFWALVSMHWGAQAITYVHSDGSRQEALLGPKAPWPSWALAPEASTLHVRSWFGPTPKESSTGQGDLQFDTPTAETVARFIAKLEAAGWTVEAERLRTTLPHIPPRQLDTCHVKARNGARWLHASLDYAPVQGLGTIAWSDGPPPPGWTKPGQSAGNC